MFFSVFNHIYTTSGDHSQSLAKCNHHFNCLDFKDREQLELLKGCPLESQGKVQFSFCPMPDIIAISPPNSSIYKTVLQQP